MSWCIAPDHTIEMINSATCPEDIFGVASDSDQSTDVYRSIWLQILKVIHPDKNPTTLENGATNKEVTDACARLNMLWEVLQTKIKNGTYGDRSMCTSTTVSIKTKRYAYILGERLHIGGTCAIFHAQACDNKRNTVQAIVKVPHSEADNDLMENEATALKTIDDRLKAANLPDDALSTLRRRLPRLLESIKLKSGKRINAFGLIEPLPWHNFAEISKAYPQGPPLKNVIFMMNRLLEALRLAHFCGVIHGNICPEHVLIHAPTHQGILWDWSCSQITGSGQIMHYPYLDKKTAIFRPHWAIAPSKKADVYAAALCFLCLLGGNSVTFELPQALPDPLLQWLNRNLQPRAIHCDADGEIAQQSFKKAAHEVFGEPEWLEFKMP